MSTFAGQLDAFAHLSLVDFEFRALNGSRPDVVCMVVRDYRSGEVRRYWRDELVNLRECPFPVGPTDAMVAFYASAELGCMLERGWRLPSHVIDLFAEHRVQTNGLQLPTGNGLLGALAWRGLARIDVAAKDAMRDKILYQSSWTQNERTEILDYCASDVEALTVLLDFMSPTLDLPRALLRGRYMAAVAKMERTGIPIDTELRQSFVEGWQRARVELVKTVDAEYGVYDGLRFKLGRFDEWLRVHGIPWPRTDAGLLKLDDDTFKEQSAVWPLLKPLRELRQALTSMHVPQLPVGPDGRNRSLLAPFASKTGRNQPSAKRFAFGLAAWQRGIIRPPEGWGLAYLDFSSQEIGIAAGLSGDPRLIEAYECGDPYLAFGKQAGFAPPDATRESHARVRDICKTVVLGLNYGLGAERMAYQAGIAPSLAAELIQRHHIAYPRYWRWSEDTVTSALLSNQMSSIFGWRRKITEIDRPTSLMNFPMQANGAEMMRIAAIAATEGRIEVCAPVHDAFLIAAPLEQLDDAIRHMREIMSRAGYHVTGGVHIRTDAKVIRYPGRYMDERGVDMWNRVVRLIDRPDAIY
ncbi:DNA polymerase [Bradyrhizobium sp. B117]|uniref:DNA polymerase n=1 Tax=Bradyrhizobium sp. B117 TaxID=3140246 RepID=UPI0031842EC9